MFKKFSERFPAAAKGLESLTGAHASAGISAAPSSASTSDAALPSENAENTNSAGNQNTDGDAAQKQQKADGDKEGETTTNAAGTPPKSDDRISHVKAAIAEKINSESVSAAASIAASSMFGLMKKAQSVASVAAREGAAKATVWKNKALDAADMDALQRRLSYALDRSTGEVNLELLNFSYITDNIVAMGFPSMNSGMNRTANEAYDYTYFDNQVLEFNFPGHPAPPLGLVFKICSSIENWLQADEKNLAAIHCLTGKGRTGTVIACYLAWIGQFPNAMESLEYIQYFTNVMDGVKPRSSPLLLRRVIINTIPVFGTRRVLEPTKKQDEGEEKTEAEGDEAAAAAASQEVNEEEMQEIVEEGCCPYLQIFKGGKLVFTTTWRDMETGNGVRHLTDSGERISMFRGAFHTGYIPQGILRLTKAQLDGACGDPRFDQDFFVDLIFADVETDNDSHTQPDGSVVTNGPKSEGVALTEEDRQAYEDMLHRDEAFWVDIEARKVRLQKLREEQQKKKQQEAEAAAARAAEAAAAAETAALAEQAQKAKEEAMKKQSSFSIVGGDEDEHFNKSTKVNRKGSWDEAKDKELMSELESITSGALAKAASDDSLLLSSDLEEKATDKSTPATDSDAMAGLAKEFEDMKNLEKELGLESFSSELASLPDGKLDARLDALDAELQGLGSLSPTAKDGAAKDVMNFAADDFDELEEYLSGLSTSSS
uniref:Phosphatidylinositol-3,4,5-trisphosphate 3-phosphatase n=1 Tax=Globisporangium ultimum (strain ATCC 200006 / CBS 805.95 / DAOM BR144) TaxID=431595 RepID=K3WKU6_GLOUD